MTAPGPPGPERTQRSGSRGKPLAFISAVVTALVVGIAIGNATRKRFDRLVHGR
jgi:hypothetical protein